jgi:hypothetical protein
MLLLSTPQQLLVVGLQLLLVQQLQLLHVSARLLLALQLLCCFKY